MFPVRRTRNVFGAILLAHLFAGPATAEPQIAKTYSYFSIGGKTADDLDAELQKRGPLTRATGFRHPGATEIRFGGEVTYMESEGRCTIGDVKVTLRTHITLPRWKNRRRADGTLGLIWDTLAADIKRHEERHAEIARSYARDLQRKLKALSARRTCKDLEADVSQLTRQMIADHDKDQLRFDTVESQNFDARMMRLLRNRTGMNAKN
ncbi:DUF922 domain-containing Zn-dependent protease [Rhizobium helianthi]|uniref:DUF922 domain-containing Zn-dependent protease n=1 Tax=Rhizobium helianthi TaxID=1132695 RepID=A0ABW4LZI8_9HYPH